MTAPPVTAPEGGDRAGRSGRTRRSVVWRRAAALGISWLGLSLIWFAGLLPPPGNVWALGITLFGFRFSLVFDALGLAGLAAAIGTWRGVEWGRRLGLSFVIALVVYEIWRFASTRSEAYPADLGTFLRTIGLDLAIAVGIACVLLLRWQPARRG